jgi:hypothetical protein
MLAALIVVVRIPALPVCREIRLAVTIVVDAITALRLGLGRWATSATTAVRV